MHMDGSRRRQARRPTNISISEALVEEAKQLGINLSQACEKGLAEEVARVRRERWHEENRPAIEAYNERIEREGTLLSAYRRF